MRNYARAILLALAALMTLLLVGAIAYGQRTRGAATNPSVTPQPLFSEYKGIRLGATATEVRARLGDPTVKGDDQDYYVISQTETAQFAYDQTHKVVTISIDYSGEGAPDYRNVVGASIDEKEDGSLYKLVRYEAQRFWVSYHRTSGTPPTVTITIQKM